MPRDLAVARPARSPLALPPLPPPDAAASTPLAHSIALAAPTAAGASGTAAGTAARAESALVRRLRLPGRRVRPLRALPPRLLPRLRCRHAALPDVSGWGGDCRPMLQEVCAGCLQPCQPPASWARCFALALLGRQCMPKGLRLRCVHVDVCMLRCAASCRCGYCTAAPLPCTHATVQPHSPLLLATTLPHCSCRALITKLERIPAAAGVFISPLTLQVGWVGARALLGYGGLAEWGAQWHVRQRYFVAMLPAAMPELQASATVLSCIVGCAPLA